MSDRPVVRIGVVGCGAIAELYHLPALARHPRTRRGIALADPNADRLQQISQQFRGRHTVSDYRDLLDKVDGVIVATPPALHYEIARFFLEHRVHVLCEKPLTESVDEASELVAAAHQHGVQLAVNQTRRLFPTYQKIQQLLSAGTLGTLRSIVYHDGIEFQWPAASPHHFRPGARGAWSDTGVHLLDTVCYWLDAPLDAPLRLVESWNDSSGGPEAMATVRLERDECWIELKVSRLGRLRNGFRIEGSTGSITADAEEWSEVVVERKDGRRERFKCGKRGMQYNDFAHPLIDNFVSVIEGGGAPLIAGASTLPTIRLLEEAYERAQRYPMPWNDHWQEVQLAG